MPSLQFRAMTVDDLPFIEHIANQSFPTPWSIKTFKRELEINARSHYWVLSIPNQWRRLHKPPIDVKQTDRQEEVVSYGGYWLLDTEAHIVSIATHPTWRHRGLGHLLLASMMIEAAKSGTESITLEVRESNQIAIRLYNNLGFQEEGRRKDYYSRSKSSLEKEDALILTRRGLQKLNSQCELIQARTAIQRKIEQQFAKEELGPQHKQPQ